jgi:hypothetical protein
LTTRVLRTSVPKREGMAGGWRRLHNEELHNFHTSPDIIKVIKSRKVKWVEHVACMGEMRSAYNILVGKPEEKRPLRRPRHRWEDNIRMDGVGRGGLDSSGSGWAHMNTVMNLHTS